MKDLENKVGIVTGAGSGIGRAITLLYAKEGANVVISDIDEILIILLIVAIQLSRGDVCNTPADGII